MVSIAITKRYVHITHHKNGLRGYTKTFRNDRISEYSRDRVYAIIDQYVVRSTVNRWGVTQYFLEM